MSKPKILVAPSLLSADFLYLAKDLKEIEEAGADWHHFDVMDGHFVPNLSFGPPLIKTLKTFISIPLDVHIMVSNPDEVALDYVNAGADRLTFHIEAANNPKKIIESIRQSSCLAGLSLNPSTPLSKIIPWLPILDQVLVMSVNPGFGGQTFMDEVLSKISELSQYLLNHKLDGQVKIVVDGGVHDRNAKQIAQVGANVLVAGSFVYTAKDRKQAIQSLKG